MPHLPASTNRFRLSTVQTYNMPTVLRAPLPANALLGSIGLAQDARSTAVRSLTLWVRAALEFATVSQDIPGPRQ